MLSFDKNLTFYKKIGFYLQSILIVSTAFIVWDVFATKHGDWAFNPDHLIGVYFFGLPLEEILFFITVPYSCIFIYETVKFYVKEKSYSNSTYIFLIPAAILILNAIIFFEKNYTSTVSVFAALFFVLAILLNKPLLLSRNFWISIAVTYIPFFLVNYFLTSLPIVTYNDEENWGIRVTTIPLDDFIYSFAMISLWILFYDITKKRKINKSK